MEAGIDFTEYVEARWPKLVRSGACQDFCYAIDSSLVDFSYRQGLMRFGVGDGELAHVQQMLGHGSASMTLDTYGHLSRTGSTRSATRWAGPATQRASVVPGSTL